MPDVWRNSSGDIVRVGGNVVRCDDCPCDGSQTWEMQACDGCVAWFYTDTDMTDYSAQVVRVSGKDGCFYVNGPTGPGHFDDFDEIPTNEPVTVVEVIGPSCSPSHSGTLTATFSSIVMCADTSCYDGNSRSYKAKRDVSSDVNSSFALSETSSGSGVWRGDFPISDFRVERYPSLGCSGEPFERVFDGIRVQVNGRGDKCDGMEVFMTMIEDNGSPVGNLFYGNCAFRGGSSVAGENDGCPDVGWPITGQGGEVVLT